MVEGAHHRRRHTCRLDSEPGLGLVAGAVRGHVRGLRRSATDSHRHLTALCPRERTQWRTFPRTHGGCLRGWLVRVTDTVLISADSLQHRLAAGEQVALLDVRWALG